MTPSLVPLALATGLALGGADGAEHRAGFEGPVGHRRLGEGPFAGPPAEAARAFLRLHPDLVPVPAEALSVRLVVPLGLPDGRGYGPQGAVVRFTQVHAGIPSADDAAVVHLDAQGRVWTVRHRALHLPELAPTPARSADEAREAAGAAPSSGAALRWWGRGAEGRLVWRVTGPLRGGDPAEPFATLVDATTGAVLEQGSLLTHAAPRARTYHHNPFVEASPTEVDLPEAVGVGLFDERASVWQCTDQQDLVTYETVDGDPVSCHVCAYTLAEGPVDGDYLFDPVPFPEDPARDEDDFVAPHTFYQFERGLAWFAERGLARLDGEPFYLFTNVRWPNGLDAEALSDPEGPLATLDNAYYQAPYENRDGEEVPGALVFGQGRLIDFAYDTDVILHELSHGVVQTLLGPRGQTFDWQGVSVEPASLNEAFADYFSSAIQGDGHVGEYAGLTWDETGAGVRDLDEVITCPGDLIGESHNDGMVFSGALWEARQALAEVDRRAFDLAIFGALATLVQDTNLSEASATAVDAVALGLGDDAAEALEAAFTARGALGCRRIVTVTPAGVDESVLRYTALPARGSLSAPLPSGPQLEVDLPAGEVRVEVALVQARYRGVPLTVYGFNRAPQPLVLLGRGGTPLSHALTEEGDQTVLTTQGEVLARFAEDPEVAPLEGTSYVYPAYKASFTVESDGGPFYLQLANEGDGVSWAYNLALEVTVLTEGRGCDTGGGRSAPPAGLWALLGLGLARRRHRRRR